jgi:hypothetical protein
MSDSNMPEVPPAGEKAVITIGGCAVAGAVLGSVIPGIGTVIGAGVGGIIGGISVIAGEIKSKQGRQSKSQPE